MILLNIEIIQIAIDIAKKNIVTQLLKNLPSFTVMPDGKFLALEDKN